MLFELRGDGLIRAEENQNKYSYQIPVRFQTQVRHADSHKQQSRLRLGIFAACSYQHVRALEKSLR